MLVTVTFVTGSPLLGSILTKKAGDEHLEELFSILLSDDADDDDYDDAYY